MRVGMHEAALKALRQSASDSDAQQGKVLRCIHVREDLACATLQCASSPWLLPPPRLTASRRGPTP